MFNKENLNIEAEEKSKRKREEYVLIKRIRIINHQIHLINHQIHLIKTQKKDQKVNK